MTKIHPWTFQVRAARRAQTAIEQRKRLLIVSPGGSGKTVIIGLIARWALQQGKRVLVISHRKEIVDQGRDHFTRMGIPARKIGLILADAVAEHIRPEAPLQVASIFTMRARDIYPEADVVIIDEAHHILAAGYQKDLQRYANAAHVGLTATPFRLDGRGLKDAYDEMFVAAMPSELIARKRLAQPLIYSAPERFLPNLRQVRISRGDYVTADLHGRVARKEIMGNVVTNWLKHAQGRKTVGFAISIAHSQALVKRFLKAGVKAVHLDGAMSYEQRSDIVTAFRNGRYTMLFNCMVLSEGWDVPECGAVILARPTKSLALFLQQANRGMRYYQGEHPILLDHGRLLTTFGLPEADRHFELTDTKLQRSDTGVAPAKACPECERVSAIGTMECPGCGFVWRGPVVPEETRHFLQRYTQAQKVALRKRLEEHAKKKGWSRTWVDEVVRVWTGYRAA